MRKFYKVLFTVSLLLVIVLAGCGKKDDDKTGEDGDKTVLNLWFSLSGENGKNFEEIIDDYNKQSDSYKINPVYQGSYTDTITKIRAVGESEAPALLMASGTNRKYLAERDYIVPVQKFIDEEDFDLSSINENVINRYTLDEKLYSMPFSASNAIMFYNKDMFEEVGLDPENPPKTFSDIEEVAQKIKDETGNIGFSMATIGWYFEQLLVNQGALYLDNENGFTGEPTETLINGPEGIEIFEWLDRMNKAGTFRNYGSNWEDPRAPFLAGELGIYFDSSANVRHMVDDAPFEIGTAALPVPDGVEPNGAQVGGNSIYITDKIPEEHQAGAWDFLKYLVSAPVQAKWAAATGYIPITEAATEEDVLKETLEEYPQMLTAVEVNEYTPAEPSTSGPLSDEGEEFRTIVETAQEQVYEGEDPKTALDNAAQKINDLLK